MNEWNFVGTMKRRRRISREVEFLYGGGKSALDLNRGEGFRTLTRRDLVSITSSTLHHEEAALQEGSGNTLPGFFKTTLYVAKTLLFLQVSPFLTFVFFGLYFLLTNLILLLKGLAVATSLVLPGLYYLNSDHTSSVLEKTQLIDRPFFAVLG